MPALPPRVDDFLTQTRVAVISTVDAEGRARAAPIWFAWEDGAAYMFTGRRTLKWRNILRAPRAALCVDDRQPPYRSVILDGDVEEVDRPLHPLVLSMAIRYYGEDEGHAFAEDYCEPRPDVAIFRLTPSRVADYL